MQDEQNVKILTHENLLSKNQRVEVANVLLRQENRRLSRGRKDKDNMMISVRMELASLETIVSGLLFLYRNITSRRQNP